ncbi:hypothetical protein B0H14DRAFT_2205718, partial [Mycena olivaceomarginata]
EAETVAELHSALDAWLSQVPPHLRWDSSRSQEDYAFFDQSVTLHTAFHYLRLLIHRSRIPM